MLQQKLYLQPVRLQSLLLWLKQRCRRRYEYELHLQLYLQLQRRVSFRV